MYIPKTGPINNLWKSSINKKPRMEGNGLDPHSSSSSPPSHVRLLSFAL